ncbi:STN domain-containing protein [Bradyrhizobium sp. Leo121]|uniref:STN domain-containing protein n=1 Tax=Bradyrhizobium sp. Leo121 TaxID=1571195 RepID=UPI001028B578|nr:STN domain-containing protein [Bradyrhizobium sp. Leo121]RZN15366.1 hypothetical protein CWO90_41660 [Bradyrhizobium sp. Leo121]
MSIGSWFRIGLAVLPDLVLVVASAPVMAQSRTEATQVAGQQQDDHSSQMMFVIPSQHLGAALRAFSTTAQIELFYESSIISGKRSFPVHGTFAPEAAMRVMLQGTGLSSASFEHGTITILSPATKGHDAAELKLAKLGVAQFSSYLALVQASLDQTLCHVPIVAGDPDELLARLWISPAGGVQHADLLSSTGSDARDRVYLATLARVATGERPPAAMPQPINLMLMPKKTQRSAACQSPTLPQSQSAVHE